MIPQIIFYKLFTSTLENALCKILEKVYAAQEKAVVIFDNLERMKAFDSTLWTYSTMAFIPHGIENFLPDLDHLQPVFLSTKIINPNQSNNLIITNGLQVENFIDFKKCLDFFDGNNPVEISKAKSRYNYYLSQGFDITVWQQNNSGWEKSAGL